VSEPLSGGRERASGGRDPDGGALGPAGGGGDRGGLRFDLAVAPGGYLWWYVDGWSDDGRHGITLIVFVGAVFSPWYAWARRCGIAEPEAHCAFHAVVYGKGGKRWALTERGRRELVRETHAIAIGPSALAWDGVALTASIDEVTAPLPTRIRGTVRLVPEALSAASFSLDVAGKHGWRPLAPCARVEVALTSPSLCWSGPAYLDSNHGAEPLEAAFASWHWSRSALGRDARAVLYDVVPRTGDPLHLALRFDGDGRWRAIERPAAVELPATRWRIPRATRSDGVARVMETLEDTPFYARSRIGSVLLGEPAIGVHESLSLDRFRAPWVQALLPFRSPRRPAWIPSARSGSSVNFV
jgi:carotenoid 1,2-hydratase